MQTSIISIRELTVRYTVRTDLESQPVAARKFIRSSADAASIASALLQDQPVEVFLMICLSTKNEVLAFCEVSRGSLDATIVHPREVFKAAFLANAASIIVAHNHPSGDPTPSTEDITLTSRLVASGELLGVPLLDHLIVGQDRYVSLKDRGFL